MPNLPLHHRLFKECFAAAADEDDVSLASSGLHDFMMDGPPEDPSELASLAILHFCVEDGKFNGFRVGLIAAIRFLERSFHKEATSECCAAIAHMLKSGTATRDSVQDWVQAWFHG